MIYKPTNAERKKWKQQTVALDKEMRNEFHRDHAIHRIVPSLSPYASHKLLGIVADAKDPVSIEMETGFIADSCCEWAYVVDLDKNVFEVHGYVLMKTPCRNKRFEDFSCAPDMVQRFDLEALPARQVFLEQLRCALL
jgi:hypothetical protein